jgi:integrase
MKLTKTVIDDLSCPEGRKDALFFDDALPGFGVRVTAAGLKVFLFQYRLGTTVRRLRFGRYGDLTPTEARRLAEVARGEIAAGRDPVGQAQAIRAAAAKDAARQAEQKASEAFTVEALLSLWSTERLAHRKPRYQREAVRALRFSLPALLPLPAAQVDATTFRRELAKVAGATTRSAGGTTSSSPRAPGTTGQTIQRRVRAYAHAMFAWGTGNGLVPSNPVSTVRVEGRQISRERVLTDAEIGEAWRAAEKMGWPWGPYFQALILTLQRASETAGMRWFEISDDRSRWELPGVRTKNGKPHIVHLSAPVQKIIGAVPRITARPDLTPSVFIFTTNGKTPISGFSHAKTRPDNNILTERIATGQARGEAPKPLDPWRLHDLRRTGVTVMARLGVRQEVADRILNHVGGTVTGVAAVYQRHEWLAERGVALDQWAAHVLACGALLSD